MQNIPAFSFFLLVVQQAWAWWVTLPILTTWHDYWNPAAYSKCFRQAPRSGSRINQAWKRGPASMSNLGWSFTLPITSGHNDKEIGEISHNVVSLASSLPICLTERSQQDSTTGSNPWACTSYSISSAMTTFTKTRLLSKMVSYRSGTLQDLIWITAMTRLLVEKLSSIT